MPGGLSEFDPSERILSEKAQIDLDLGDLLKDTEDCGPKVYECVAKRVNNACTKRPAKEQFSSAQKKYLRLETCEFLSSFGDS